MVSLTRAPRPTPGKPGALPATTRDRLLDAATAEFAAKGFDGAKVDRIAARARVNKAMIYYHFRHKAGLYRAILRTLFDSLAKVAADIAASDAPADVKVSRFVRGIALEATMKPHFPAIWLREMADAGRHLDVETVSALGQAFGAFARILDEGRRTQQFTPTQPFLTHLGVVAPLLLFAASAPFRNRFAGVLPAQTEGLDREAMVGHVIAGAQALLKPQPAAGAAPARRGAPSRKGRS